TFAIVQVPHAKGAQVSNSSQVRVDSRGYAVVPHLVPYQLNRIDIDPLGLPLDVELATNSQHVAPRAGTVALLRYPTVSGRTALIELRRPCGVPLPFGAQVSDEQGTPMGVVGQGSRVLARGLQAHGNLRADWGTGQCTARYHLPTPGESLVRLAAVCETASKEQP
ncbi:FimD/PapC C-terminal domain-containing protein, partial [Pseudomonas sp.]